MERETNNISLISVLQTINVAVPEPGADKVSVPFRWNILAMWGSEPGDERKTFHQSFDLLGPDGQALQSFAHTFTIPLEVANTVVLIPAFPIVRGGGQYTIVLYLREADQAERTKIATYPLTVRFSEASAPSS